MCRLPTDGAWGSAKSKYPRSIFCDGSYFQCDLASAGRYNEILPALVRYPCTSPLCVLRYNTVRYLLYDQVRGDSQAQLKTLKVRSGSRLHLPALPVPCGIIGVSCRV